METPPPLQPTLKIRCTSTSCNQGLHSFKPSPKMRSTNEQGRCRSCGEELVDWDRVHRRDPRDADFTFASLQNELIRHHFWHVEMDERAIAYARRKGTTALRQAARRIIGRAVGPAQPFRDGYQTPREGSCNPVHYAQHATASCCRKCVEEWHGIPEGRPLTDDELDYLSELAMRFLAERLPQLTEGGETVPPRRAPRAANTS